MFWYLLCTDSNVVTLLVLTKLVLSPSGGKAIFSNVTAFRILSIWQAKDVTIFLSPYFMMDVLGGGPFTTLPIRT